MSVRVIYQVCKVSFTGLQVEYQEIQLFNLLYLKINVGDYRAL
jgi:hypothetical protein